MHVVVRRYEEVPTSAVADLVRQLDEGYKSLQGDVAGYVAHGAVGQVSSRDGSVVSVSIFRDSTEAAEFNKAAGDWAGSEYLGSTLHYSPEALAVGEDSYFRIGNDFIPVARVDVSDADIQRCGNKLLGLKECEDPKLHPPELGWGEHEINECVQEGIGDFIRCVRGIPEGEPIRE